MVMTPSPKLPITDSQPKNAKEETHRNSPKDRANPFVSLTPAAEPRHEAASA